MLGAAATWTLPVFLEKTFFALDAMAADALTQTVSGKDGTILVVLQMAGGNDGLNMVVPYADDAYHRARPRLGLAADKVLKIDNYAGLNGKLTGLKVALRRRPPRDRARRGLSKSQSIAFSFDRNLAKRFRCGSQRERGLARAVTSTIVAPAPIPPWAWRSVKRCRRLLRRRRQPVLLFRARNNSAGDHPNQRPAA